MNIVTTSAESQSHEEFETILVPRRPFPQRFVCLCLVLLLLTVSFLLSQLLFNSVQYVFHSCDGTDNTHKFSGPHFAGTRRHLPSCLIIGARKCGTRALLEFLDLHPNVRAAAEEVHFFDNSERYLLGLDWYRRRMPYSFPGQVTVEKTPAYFVTPAAPARIRFMDPAVRLLLIVRDPTVRLVSDYAQLAANRARKSRPLLSFEDMVLRADGAVDESYRAVRTGLYAKFFPRWLRYFPRKQIHLVDGDALVEDPYEEIVKVEEFLRLEHKIQPENFVYNETKGFFCVSNTTAVRCLSGSKGRKHPEVSVEVIKKLRKYYAPYNELFFRQAGVSFNWPIE
ncbi:heparan sulfate glucosamine 3-O-sulfotransferase 1-like [Uloborus diversus]|uniref:heparan sulfate glucosamine 3-O-sulfotransferase 1-like n=1 Tax=Uloborus diversus TaxID=327109 RepID=UPI002409F537|nr:heparan sulfate glucosamine 3-O-sulfotransferase 1-like [Uloborus diversus]XP_054706093.1 heparan sulfate glucosamine 3-O-sulfotransferase 1-like [Uloborus diversus]